MQANINGDVKLVLEFTHDEILRNYFKLDNLDDLLNSDILILPSNKEGGFRNIQPLDMVTEFDELDIKYYVKDQDQIKRYLSASYLDCLDIGVLLVSNINSLIAIADFLFKRYEGTLKINIQLFNKTVHNTYIYNDYEGDVNNFYNYDVEKMKNDFEHNGP